MEAEDRLDDLKAAAQASFLEKSFPSRDPAPPRDFITGMPGDYVNIMALNPGTGDGFGERDAFARRLRSKEEKSIQEKHEECERAARGGARVASTEQREETRRDVTGTFSEGRSMIGRDVGDSSDDRRDPSSGARVEADVERARRDVTGANAESQRPPGTHGEAMEPSLLWEGRRRDISGRDTYGGMLATGPIGAADELRRDITFRLSA